VSPTQPLSPLCIGVVEVSHIHAPTHVINLTCELYIIKIHVNITLGRNYREAVGKKKNIGKESF
jgi:hypothetical protein